MTRPPRGRWPVIVLVCSGLMAVAMLPASPAHAVSPPAVLPPPAAVAAQTGVPTAYTANICGASGCDQLGDPHQVDHVKNRIDALGGTPLHVGIQEACGNQVQELGVWLRWTVDPDYQTAMYAQLAGADARESCGGRSTVYGVASYVLAAPGTPQTLRAFVAQDSVNDDEIRGSACILGAAGYFYTGCTAHVTKGLQGFQENQFEEYVNVDIVPRATGGNAHAVLGAET
jgi:hypothetical protein